jgi:hypothetical protein
MHGRVICLRAGLGAGNRDGSDDTPEVGTDCVDVVNCEAATGD